MSNDTARYNQLLKEWQDTIFGRDEPEDPYAREVFLARKFRIEIALRSLERKLRPIWDANRW